MPHKFAFYSTDIAPTTDPANADPAPATLVVLDQDPVFPPATYDPMAGQVGRGSVIPTLGGAQIQQFAARLKDRRIQFADVDALTQANVDDLQDLYDAAEEVYFTDGYEIWKVRFEPVNGLRYRKNLAAAYNSLTRYAYEISLVPTWQQSTATTTTTSTSTSTTTTTTTTGA